VGNGVVGRRQRRPEIESALAELLLGAIAKVAGIAVHGEVGDALLAKLEMEPESPKCWE
jgi:hypothetical protein